MARSKETYLHHYHRPETLQNRLRRQSEEGSHEQMGQLIYSNSIQHLHSRELIEEPSYTYHKDMSQDKYGTKSIVRRQPRKYVPLSRQQTQTVKEDRSASKWQKRKQIQYTQSDEYKRYHEQIFKNSHNSKEIMDRIKTLRSNNIYIPKEEAIERVTKRIDNHKKTFIQSNYGTQSLSNLSKITEKQMILIHDPDVQDLELTCQPYLESTSNFSNALKQEIYEKREAFTPYNKLNEDRTLFNRAKESSKDEELSVNVEKWKKKGINNMRQSKQNFQRISLTKKISKERLHSPSTKEPMKEISSIYNIDFKLDRPTTSINTSSTRCLTTLNLSQDRQISPNRSTNKTKMSVITASGRKPR